MRHPRGRWPDRDELVRLTRDAQRDGVGGIDALLVTLRPAFDRYFARRLTRDAAEDLTQAALIRVAQEVRELDAARVGHHVTTLARTLLQTEYLRQARALRQSAPAKLGEVVASPFDIARQTEYEELVNAVLHASANSLPPELGTVVLGLLRDRSLAEIAAEAGTDPFTIRMRLHRARTLLRRHLWAYIDRGIRAGALLTMSMLGLQVAV